MKKIRPRINEFNLESVISNICYMHVVLFDAVTTIAKRA